MTRQDQRTSDGSIALQAAGDVVIGFGPDQMSQVLTTLAAQQTAAYTAIAREIVDARMAEFKARLLDRFGKQDAKPEAFKDPDFQYSLARAQQAYARSGDVIVQGTLVDLIARRSMETGRSRLSLTLNDAIEKTAVLTRNEFAALSLSYVIRHAISGGIGNLAGLKDFFEKVIKPLLPDVSRGASSYQYLEAHSCCTINPIGGFGLHTILLSSYGGIFSRGFDKEALKEVAGSQVLAAQLVEAQLVIPCMNNEAKLQLAAINKDAFLKRSVGAGIIDAELNGIWSRFERTFYDDDELWQFVSPSVPEIRELASIWNQSPLKRMKLTTVGIAVGHANLVRVAGWAAPLSIWIE